MEVHFLKESFVVVRNLRICDRWVQQCRRRHTDNLLVIVHF